MSETFPWTLDARTAGGKDGTVTWQHGMLNFFGGRSTTWSAWCPRPNDDELDGWPEVLKSAARKNFRAAEELLNVQNADKIDAGYSPEVMDLIHKSCKRPVYRALQKAVQTRLEGGRDDGDLSKPGIYRTDPAPLACRSDIGVDFQKFSTNGPLLELLLKYENLHIATNVTVKRVLRQGGQATALETSRGLLPLLGDTKLVLAMGTLPPTTLVRNSFPELANIGKRFSSHFITSVVARVPKSVLEAEHNPFGALEVGAMYVAGVADGDYKKQYHIQLSALYDESPDKNYNRAMRYMPDVVATASPEQLRSSVGHVVFVCAVLGELDYRTETNAFLGNPEDPEVTTNSKLRVVSNGAIDAATWSGMDDATFTTLEWLAGGGDTDLEYWRDGFGWTKTRPSTKERRVDAMVHESSTLHAGDEDDAPVDPSSYLLKGTDNVYITGGGLWPQGGSWNPTMTMTALAMDLADKITCLSEAVSGYDVEEIVASLDPADNVYLVLKDVESRYLWVNENFANLVGVPSSQLIGTKDTHEAHVEHDREVLSSGKPLYNFEETIEVPGTGCESEIVKIRTQKGLIRSKSNPEEVVGLTVCFSIIDEKL